MSSNLGEAVLELTANSDKLESELDKSKTKTEGKIQQFQKVFSAILTSAVLSQIVQAYKQVVVAAEQSLVAEAKVAAVIRATGNAAGYTVGQMSDMADQFSRMSGVDDEMILNAEAVLLTFRQIGHEVFPEATQAALDMSAVMGQDLQSSIVQIGKALNDPIAGISALSRVGVTFTEEQKDMIKGFMAQNDIMSAQGVILQELQNEFGGAAQAMEEASSGSNRLKVAWGNMQEEIGKNFLPAQREANIALAETIERELAASEAVDKHAYYIDLAKQKLREQTGEVNISTMAASRLAAQLQNNDQVNQNMANSYTAMAAKYQQFSGGLDSALQLQVMDYTNLLNLTSSLANETTRFNEQQETVKSKQAEIQTEINNLIAAGYSPLSEKVMDLKEKYSDLGLEYDQNAIEHRAATNKIIYDLFLQKLSVDGLTQSEFDMALQFGVATGQMSQESADQAAAFDAVTQAAMEGKISVDEMTTAIAAMQDKSITITVDQIVRSRYFEQQLDMRNTLANYASGTDGWETVPSGFPNDTYTIGLTSGESYAVIPNQSSISAPAIAGGGGGAMDLSSGGGGMIIQFTYQPFIGVNDEYEAEQKLRGIVEKITRRGSNQ